MMDKRAPLWLLSHCHARMHEHLQTFGWLAEYLEDHGSDLLAQLAAQRVLRYFDTDAPMHRVLEEQEFFPAVLESMAGSDAVCLREMTEGFTQEHRLLARQWLQLRPTLEAVAQAAVNALPAREVEAFVQLGYRHIERKEQELLPTAARLISDEELTRINRSFAEGLGI